MAALFLVIIFGHLVTFTMGEWLRVPIAKGVEVFLVRGDTPLVVKEIHHEYFPGNSRLRNRISRSRVTLENDSGDIIHVGYLKPVHYRGKHLLLDMVKTKRRAEKRVEFKHAAEELSNKGASYHVQRLQKKDEDKSQKLQIKVISDPGLYIIITAFTLILIFMLWYFAELQLKR